MRVTTQLTDASSGIEEWSDVFDGESDDWFALHEDMAVRIAESLDLFMSPTEKDQAIATLQQGIELGFDEFDAIEGSRYFDLLHDDPRFLAIVDSGKTQAGD